jgi:hypothetical protein
VQEVEVGGKETTKQRNERCDFRTSGLVIL